MPNISRLMLDNFCTVLAFITVPQPQFSDSRQVLLVSSLWVWVPALCFISTTQTLACCSKPWSYGLLETGGASSTVEFSSEKTHSPHWSHALAHLCLPKELLTGWAGEAGSGGCDYSPLPIPSENHFQHGLGRGP